MRNLKYLIIPLAILLGFAIGWMIKPSGEKEVHNHPSSVEQGSEIWTCSMHPQIRQGEQGDCPICGMDLIPADQNATSNPLAMEMTEEAVQLANIQTSVVGGRSDGESSIVKLNGTVQADETRIASLVAHIPGRIEQLYVSFTGEPVRRGQKIASIYSPDLITAQKELIEVQKLKNISPALLDATRNKLRYWKINDDDINRILSTGEVQERFDIFADHSGVVTERKVAVGDHVMEGGVMFDIVDLSRVWVLFDAYEENIPNISEGQNIRFTTTSLPGKNFNAAITFIDPVINPTTRVATVRTEVGNRSQSLKPGMLVTGMVSGEHGRGGELTVPRSAVLWTGERSVVYVKLPDTELPSYEYREIILGESTGPAYVVKEGLEKGEEVVTNGAFVIDASAQLNNQSSMMNRMAGLKGREDADVLPNYQEETPEEFKVQLQNLLAPYIQLKDALVNSDATKAASFSVNLYDEVAKVDMTLISGEANKYWLDQQGAIANHSKKIAWLKDLEAQRDQFDFLSQAMIKSITVFGMENEIYFVQHCPMVKGDQGAEWISQDAEVFNPYFGDRMLKCGWVVDTLGIN